MSETAVDTCTWRQHPTYTAYEVSDDGRVRSTDRIVLYKNGRRHHRKGVELALQRHPDGYRTVSLSVNGVVLTRLIHVLVCETFHGSRPTPGHEARHLNGRPFDNRSENLAWGTGSENCMDAVRHGRHFWASKTHCPQGHEYTPENTLRDGRGRKCRICNRRRCAERAQRKRQKHPSTSTNPEA